MHQRLSAALLRRLIRDPLPAHRLCGRLFRIVAHNDVLRLNGIDCRRTKLNRLLYDEIHLLALEERLHENDFCARLCHFRKVPLKPKAYRVARDGDDRHACHTSIRVCDRDLVPNLRAHDACEMVGVTACDLNLLCQFPCVKQPPHQQPSSELRRMIIAAHSFSQVISSTV